MVLNNVLPNIEKITSDDKILVTGGTGLFGQAIKEVVEKHGLKGEWFFAGSKDGDLRDYEQTKQLFEKVKPTYVLHLAAFVGGLFRNMNHKVQFWFDNVNMNNNVLKLSNDSKVKKVVSCLSTCVFPDDISYPFDESSLHNGPPHESNNAYAYTKRMLDMLGRWYNEANENGKKGTQFVSVIPTNLFGKHDNYNVQNGHVLPGLMHKCKIAKETGADFVVYGSGKPLRQFLYAFDAAELMVWSLLNYEDVNEPVMLSVSEEDEQSIGDVANAIKEAFEFKGNMVFDTSKSDGQFKKTASNKKLLSLFPSYKFTPFKEAVKESVQWFVDNYETARK